MYVAYTYIFKLIYESLLILVSQNQSPTNLSLSLSLSHTHTHTHTHSSAVTAFKWNKRTAVHICTYVLNDLLSSDQLMDQNLNLWPFPPDQLSSQEWDCRISADTGLMAGTFESHLNFGGHTGTDTSHHAYTNCWKHSYQSAFLGWFPAGWYILMQLGLLL